MYTLRDVAGKFICNIDSNADERRIIIRDINRKEIGFGKEETHVILVNSVHLVLDNGEYIGTLDRELGLDGRPDCVRITAKEVEVSVPVKEFGNPYIIHVLFGDYDPTGPETETDEKTGGNDPAETGTGSAAGDAVSVLFPVLLLAAGIAAFAFLQKTMRLYQHEVIFGLLTGMPVLSGLILLLICLFHKGGGKEIRLSGLAEAVLTACAVWCFFFIHSRCIIGDSADPWMDSLRDWFSRLSPVLEMAGSLLSVLILFILMFVPFILLAVLYRTVSSRVQDSGRRSWLKDINEKYHRVLLIAGASVFYLTLMVFSTEKLFEAILLGVFYSAFLYFAVKIAGKISRRIMRKRKQKAVSQAEPSSMTHGERRKDGRKV